MRSSSGSRFTTTWSIRRQDQCRTPNPFGVADQVALHLRGHRGDHEQHLVGDRGAVGPVDPGADAGEDVKVDAPGVQLVFQQHEQFLHGPGDPVRLVDHQGVAGLQRVQGLAQRLREAPRRDDSAH